MLRNILSVIVGVICAGATFLAAESLTHKIFPFPSDLDASNIQDLGSYLGSVDIGYWLIVLVGYLIGSFLAGFVIQKISKTDKLVLPLIAGVLLTLSSVANMFVIKHPTWFVIVAILIFIPAVLLGNKVAKSK